MCCFGSNGLQHRRHFGRKRIRNTALCWGHRGNDSLFRFCRRGLFCQFLELYTIKTPASSKDERGVCHDWDNHWHTFLFLFVSWGKQKIKKQCLTTLLLPVESITILLLITGLWLSQEPMNECKITIYFNMFLHHKLHALCFFERFFEKQGKNEGKYTKTKKNETFIKVFDFFS